MVTVSSGPGIIAPENPTIKAVVNIAVISNISPPIFTIFFLTG